MKKLLLTTVVLGLLSTPAFAQSWGRGGGYVGADRNQGYYPRKGVHRCVVNLQTAKSLGIEMPLSLLMRVSEAVE